MFRALSLLVLFLLSLPLYATRPYVLILGIGQDAGVPQMGCESAFCKRAWADPSLRQTVSSIALVDPDTGERWIFDATPDLPEQFEMLKHETRDLTNSITGIFLTHAHIGHYTGLMYLGRESMNTKRVPVYAMPRMATVLEQSAPWSQLVAIENIVIKPLANKEDVQVNDRLAVEPFLVPHRDEFSETVGYRITSGKHSLIFIPDIDKWSKLDVPLTDLVRSADHLIVDGSFYADGELPNRPMSEVPHPFVTETMDLLRSMPRDQRSKVIFIHFNHTNPLVQGDRTKIREVTRRGFRIAAAGMKISL